MTRRTKVISVLAAVLLLVLAVPVGLTFMPQKDQPGKSDAILVLGPPVKGRMDVARQMMREGRAKTLVISEPDDPYGPRVSDCRTPQPYKVICFAPNPATTQGEAEHFRELATQNHWQSVQVITFWPHVNRARLLMQRCFAGNVAVIQSSDPVYPLDVIHHLGGWVKLATYWDC